MLFKCWSTLGENDLFTVEGNVVCDIFTASSHIDDKERILRELSWQKAQK